MLNRVTIDSTGSTSASGTGGRRPFLNSKSPRSVPPSRDSRFDFVGVLAEDLVPAGPGRMLQQENRFRGEQVQFALAAEGVLAANLEAPMHALGRVLRVGAAVPQFDLFGDHVQPDAAELAGVPVKYSSTTPLSRPIASKACAAV